MRSARLAPVLLVAVGMASAQTLVDSERAGELRKRFDSSAASPPFRCQIRPRRPELDYSLRFQTGYVISLPMGQFTGSGHSLNTFLRVTPVAGREPVWLETG